MRTLRSSFVDGYGDKGHVLFGKGEAATHTQICMYIYIHVCVYEFTHISLGMIILVIYIYMYIYIYVSVYTFDTRSLESTYTSTCTPFQYAEIEQRPSETLGIRPP